jgi:hypothetical protein
MKICCGITSLRYFQASIKLRLFLRIICLILLIWLPRGIKKMILTLQRSLLMSMLLHVPSLDMGNRLQNLLTMIDSSEEAGMDFMKRVESSVRLLYGEYAANSMEYCVLI